MDYETLKTELLKLARNAFETACTLRENQRIEVYLNSGEPMSSDCLEENEEIIYGLFFEVAGRIDLDLVDIGVDRALILFEQSDDGDWKVVEFPV